MADMFSSSGLQVPGLNGLFSNNNQLAALGAASLFGGPGLLGFAVGQNLGSLALPNMNMQSLVTAAIALPIITTLTTPYWSRGIFGSPVGGIAAGLFAGAFLAGLGNNQNSG